MTRRLVWTLAALLALVLGIGIIGLVSNGSCGCADPNAVCAAQPCPSSDALWFVCVFVGAFGASILTTAGFFIGHNARLRAYQGRQAPVTAELPAPPVQSMSFGSVLTSRPWSTPPVTVDEATRQRELSTLDELRQSGALSDAEYEQEKRAILGG